jgi:hypothetical protein
MKLGISPDLLPQELLAACRGKSKHWASTASNLLVDDGHWLIDLMKDSYDATTKLGATTMLLASLSAYGQLLTANIGDCSLIVLRVIPAGVHPATLQAVFKTTPTRYDATKPVQVQRLPHMPEDRTHTVIKGSKLEAFTVQSGDYVVLGSDGLFDNLRDEDIQRVVDRHCPKDRAASTAVLNEAAAALVNTAIAKAQPKKKDDAPQQQDKQGLPWAGQEPEPTHINPDDTTALVAAVVEVPDIDEYERWFYRSRGIPLPQADNMSRTASNSNSAQPRQAQAQRTQPMQAPQQAQPPGRARSVEPAAPLQDCTNTPDNIDPSACHGQQRQGSQSARLPSFKGKGAGKGGKGQGKGECAQGLDAASNGPASGPAAAAPDWWTKMSVPGRAAPPAQYGTPAHLAMQAEQAAAVLAGKAPYPAQNRQNVDDYNQPTLTSNVLRAHEVKMATAESIARYSTAANVAGRGSAPLGWRPPPIPQGQERRPSAPRNSNENCVVS